MEREILSAMVSSRGSYELVREALSGSYESAFSSIGSLVAKSIEDFYTKDPSAGSCSKEIIANRATEKILNPKSAGVIQSFVEGLDGSVSVPNLISDLRRQRRFRVGDKIAGLLANRQEGSEVDELLKIYQELGQDVTDNASDGNDVYRGVGLDTLLERHFDSETISLGLPSLDRMCDGGARPGHHVLVFARPEIGKTLVTLNLVRAFAERERTSLYIGNEDPMPDLVLRFVGALTRRTKEEIRRDPRSSFELAKARNYDFFIGAPLSPGSYPEIARLCDKYQPQVVVLDQLRNIDVGDDNRVTALEKAAIGARNLAKSLGVLVVSVTQAGDSAEGKSHLELSDIDFSKTGIPGAIDLAIGVGASNDDKRYGFRTINVSKNKLGGVHDSFQVRVDPRIGLVEEI